MNPARTCQNGHTACIELQGSKFFTAMKSTMTYIKVSGINLAPDCLKSIVSLDSSDPHNRYVHNSNTEVVLQTEQNKTGDNFLQHVAGYNNNREVVISSNLDSMHLVDIKTEQNKPTKGRVIRVKPAVVKKKGRTNKTSPIISEKGKGNISYQCSQKPYAMCLRYLFSLAVLLLHALDTGRMLWVLPKYNVNDGNFVYLLSNITFKLFLTFLHVTSCYVTHKHYLPMCYSILKYEQKYGLDFNRAKLRVWFASVLIFGSIMSAIVVVSISVGVLAAHTDSYYNMWPLDPAYWTHRFAALCLSAFGSCFGCLVTFSSHALRGIILFFLLNEIKQLQGKVTTILLHTSDPAKLENGFDEFIEQLRAFSTVVENCFVVVKHTIAAAFIFPPILSCMVLSYWASGNVSWYQALVTVYTVLLGLVMVATATALCGKLRSQGRAIWSSVYKVPWCSVSPTMLHKLSIFTQQPSVTDFGYSVYGLFTVDYSSLMMMGGTILTYGIFVLQLKLEHGPSLVCEVVNKTC